MADYLTQPSSTESAVSKVRKIRSELQKQKAEVSKKREKFAKRTLGLQAGMAIGNAALKGALNRYQLRNQPEINRKFKNIVWDRLDNRIYSRIYFVIEKRSLNNKVNLPRLTIGELNSSSTRTIFYKMAALTDKFYKVFDPVLKKIDIKKIEKKL